MGDTPTVHIDFDNDVIFVFDCGNATVEDSTTVYTMRATTPAVSYGSDGIFESNGDLKNLTSVEINGESIPASGYSVI